MENKCQNQDQFEYDCQLITAKNAVLLDGFKEWLIDKGLSPKTVSKHVSNIEFYLNIYLLRMDAVPANEGWEHFYVDDFLGYFLIRKCMWSRPSTIKQNGASLKKFYEYMVVRGEISQEDFDSLKRTIKYEMPVWVEDCRRFNEPEYDSFGIERFLF